MQDYLRFVCVSFFQNSSFQKNEWIILINKKCDDDSDWLISWAV